MKREIINSDSEMRLALLRELQSATGEELDALLPSVLQPQGGRSKANDDDVTAL